ncbi:MAG: hypothetical protein PHH26_04480 [Candidatus Thermoplasmatota archaeon]|nr:hypothetical protein [Candidatus Thermoplasmatota archaeon]
MLLRTIDAILLAAMTFAFLYLGFSLMRRKVDPGVRRYMVSFSLWWILLGIITGLIGVVIHLLAFLNYMWPVVYLAYAYIVLIMLAMSLLINYLAFIYLGEGKALRTEKVIVSIYYGALTAYLLYITYIRNPYPAFSGFAGIAIKYEIPLDSLFPAATLVTTSLVYIPQFIVLGLLFKLRSKLEDATSKYRITLVAVSITIWFVYGFIISAAEITGSAPIHFFGRLVALVAALIVLTAYFPPKFIQKRCGVKSLGEA